MERSELEEIMRLVDLSVSVCLFARLCTRIGGNMHSNERLLVAIVDISVTVCAISYFITYLLS